MRIEEKIRLQDLEGYKGKNKEVFHKLEAETKKLFSSQEKETFRKLEEETKKLFASQEIEDLTKLLNAIKGKYSQPTYYNLIVNLLTDSCLKENILEYMELHKLFTRNSKINSPSHRHTLKKEFMDFFDEIVEIKVLDLTNSIVERLNNSIKDLMDKKVDDGR